MRDPHNPLTAAIFPLNKNVKPARYILNKKKTLNAKEKKKLRMQEPHMLKGDHTNNLYNNCLFVHAQMVNKETTSFKHPYFLKTKQNKEAQNRYFM